MMASVLNLVHVAVVFVSITYFQKPFVIKMLLGLVFSESRQCCVLLLMLDVLMLAICIAAHVLVSVGGPCCIWSSGIELGCVLMHLVGHHYILVSCTAFYGILLHVAVLHGAALNGMVTSLLCFFPH